MPFIHPGYLPAAACPIPGPLPDGDDRLKYPLGFSLEDYMAIFWKVDGWSASGIDSYYRSGTGIGVVEEDAVYLSDLATYLPSSPMRQLVCNAVSRTFRFRAEVRFFGTGYFEVFDPYDYTEIIEDRAVLTIQEPTYLQDGLYYPEFILNISQPFGGALASTDYPLRRSGVLNFEVNGHTYTTPIGIDPRMDYPPADTENFVDLTVSAASERPPE